MQIHFEMIPGKNIGTRLAILLRSSSSSCHRRSVVQTRIPRRARTHARVLRSICYARAIGSISLFLSPRLFSRTTKRFSFKHEQCPAIYTRIVFDKNIVFFPIIFTNRLGYSSPDEICIHCFPSIFFFFLFFKSFLRNPSCVSSVISSRARRRFV